MILKEHLPAGAFFILHLNRDKLYIFNRIFTAILNFINLKLIYKTSV